MNDQVNELSEQVHLPARVETAEQSDVVIVRFPRGKVDGVAVRELYETAAALTSEPSPRLLVDFTGVPVISSGTLGILAAVRKMFMHVDGRLHIHVPNDAIRNQIRTMNLHMILRLFDSAEEAMAAFE